MCSGNLSAYAASPRAWGERRAPAPAPRMEKAPLYNGREQAALAWAEAVAQVAVDVTDQEFKNAREWYTEEELVELTLVILATNAWNRMAISFRQLPDVIFYDNSA
jgi:alkylhydroperoxidase family enzyme